MHTHPAPIHTHTHKRTHYQHLRCVYTTLRRSLRKNRINTLHFYVMVMIMMMLMMMMMMMLMTT